MSSSDLGLNLNFETVSFDPWFLVSGEDLDVVIEMSIGGFVFR